MRASSDSTGLRRSDFGFWIGDFGLPARRGAPGTNPGSASILYSPAGAHASTAGTGSRCLLGLGRGGERSPRPAFGQVRQSLLALLPDPGCRPHAQVHFRIQRLLCAQVPAGSHTSSQAGTGPHRPQGRRSLSVRYTAMSPIAQEVHRKPDPEPSAARTCFRQAKPPDALWRPLSSWPRSAPTFFQKSKWAGMR